MVTKKGFTLSEVMVAMTVLGVIAAVLVPSVMKTMPSNSKVLFKKAYATVEKSITNLLSDDTNYPPDQLSGSTSRGLNYTTATTNTSNKLCYFLTDQLNYVGSITCPGTGAATNAYFTTTDGIVWSIDYPGGGTDAAPDTQFPIASNSYATKIVVDVNGISNGPNCSADSAANTYFFGDGASAAALTRCTNYNVNHATKGYCSDNPDRYIIGVRYDGKLQIGSGGTTDLCANQILSAPTTNQ